MGGEWLDHDAASRRTWLNELMSIERMKVVVIEGPFHYVSATMIALRVANAEQ